MLRRSILPSSLPPFILFLGLSLSVPSLFSQKDAQASAQTTSGMPQTSSDAAAKPSNADSTASTNVPPPSHGGTATPSPTGNGVMPGVKPGSIDDVSAIGTRDIGGRGMGNWYSTESEIKMGRAYAAQIDKSTKFITDPVVNEYVNRLVQNLVKSSDAKVPFTVKIIDSDSVNAFALPGGFLYFNSGLILAADEEAELAGVMAHEMSHVIAHHAARQMTRSNYAQIASMASMIVIPGLAGYGVYEGSQLAVPLAFMKFSREYEAQADYLGVQYLYKAGYDPEAFVSFFEKIEDLEKRTPGSMEKAFASHPQTPDRIKASQEEIARILPPRGEYLMTTSEFDDVKARLARIENKRKIRDNGTAPKPVLRRASTSDGQTGDGSGNTSDSAQSDDRPTLHRSDNQPADPSTPTTTSGQ